MHILFEYLPLCTSVMNYNGYLHNKICLYYRCHALCMKKLRNDVTRSIHPHPIRTRGCLTESNREGDERQILKITCNQPYHFHLKYATCPNRWC